jgi:hypothetical protein
VESSRGGGALADACRTARVLNRMSKEDAEKAGVDNHRLYFRTFNDKANLVQPVMPFSPSHREAMKAMN